MKPNKENALFFEKLYKEMAHKLFLYASSRIPDKENAEDIVEETFATAWQKFPDLIASDNPHGWLINALKLHILKYYEKRAKEHPEKREFGEIEAATETVFDNEISFNDRLSDDEMRIINLKAAGYKHDEISAVMDLPAGTIHSKVSRIKDKLKKFLGGEIN
jgi:RNA polymerase sigma-70 factor (ECF subfamily)